MLPSMAPAACENAVIIVNIADGSLNAPAHNLPNLNPSAFMAAMLLTHVVAGCGGIDCFS